MRVHFASFDAKDKGINGDYNRENCQMAVDLLNENVRRLNGGEQAAHFWCEKGSFKP